MTIPPLQANRRSLDCVRSLARPYSARDDNQKEKRRKANSEERKANREIPRRAKALLVMTIY